MSRRHLKLLLLLHFLGYCVTHAKTNNGVDQSREDPETHKHNTENEETHEEPPILEDNFEDDVLNKETEELEEVGKQQETSHKTNTDPNKRIEKEGSDSEDDDDEEDIIEEGTVEVFFDSGEVKITKKLANGDVLQLPGLKMMLGTPETDIEDEVLDTPTEDEEVVIGVEEEGDELYEEAMKILSLKIGSFEVDRPYQLLMEAAAVGNCKAQEQLGYFSLFGMHVQQNVSKSVEIFSKLAAVGFPGGQMGLGLLYSTGLGVNASQTKAIMYYTFAALQGHSLAQMAMGYRSHMGVGVSLNCDTALAYYSKVAKEVADSITITGGAAISRVRLFDEEEQVNDVGNMDEDLIQYYQFLAEKGDLQAQMLLGQLYMQGLRGVGRDFKKALYYFSLADEEKNAAAQGFMGKIYAEGSEDVPASSTTALEYFKGAAKKGNPIGLSGLGMMYLHGLGTKRDYTKAFKYSAQSAEMGWLDGQLQLGIMYYNGYGMQRNYRQALRYFSLASQSGSTLAIYYLGKMHAFGIGVPKSCHTAVEFMKTVAEKGKINNLFVHAYDSYKLGSVDTSLVQYLLLAELGYEVAQSNAAYIAENTYGSQLVDNELLLKRTLMLWSRAASQGYGTARLKMGDYYYYGKGTDVNYYTAASHYQIASEQLSVARAMFNLGYMYEQGIGLNKDFHLAKRYYDLAVETDQVAQVPVNLALMKLHFNYYYELFSIKLRDFELSSVTLYLQLWFGHNWDIYLITFLVLLSTLIYLTRQHRRLDQRRAAAAAAQRQDQR